MTHVKHYSEVIGPMVYYLFDGFNQKEVSESKFKSSSGYTVNHNSAKPEQEHTKSETGIVIEKFNDFKIK